MSGNTFLWTGDADDGEFQDANNWSDTTSSTVGPPGPADTALVETNGSINGHGLVNALVLEGNGGLLTSTASLQTEILTLEGSVALSGETEFEVSGEVKQVGTATATINDGTDLLIDNAYASGTSGYTATPLDIGVSSGDHSAFNLTGFGTQVTLKDGDAVVGDAGIGAMTISSGAELETDDASGASGSGEVILGNTTGGQGTLTITGPSSALQTSGGIFVGLSGQGSLSILAGAEASIIDLHNDAIALFVSNGSVLVSGAGSRLIANYDNSVSYIAGAGAALTIAGAGIVELGSLVVAHYGTGSVFAEGTDTLLEIRGSLTLGMAATGSLQVTSGAQVIQDSYTSDGLGLYEATGSILVSGTGSTFDSGVAPLVLGDGGIGAVTISAGGTIVTSTLSGTTAYVGSEASSTTDGSVTITGTGSNWNATGEFDVGYDGNGTLVVEAGGALETGDYNLIAGFVVGSQAGSVGTATVTRTGSTLTNDGEFVIGMSGSGKLTISSGALVTTTLPSGSSTDGAILGDYAGSTGTVSVTGSGSEWSVGSDLIVGDSGTGSLTIGAGSTVSAGNFVVALDATRSLNVSGTSAKLLISGVALFGISGKANVAIGSGAELSVGGNAALAYGRIGLSGGELSVSGTLTEDAGQLISGFGTVQASSLINSSTVQASGGTLNFIGGVTGTGNLQIEASSTLSLSGSVSSGQRTTFEASTSQLVLGTPASFASTIYDFIKGNTIDLSNVIASSLTYGGQTLTVHESGGASLGLKFSGTYSQSSFGMTSDGHSGTLITHT
jgi:T5SS/PEP-CTERM-associated repeat protein